MQQPRSGTTALYSYFGQRPDIAKSAQEKPAYCHYRELQPDFYLLPSIYGSERKSESQRQYKMPLSLAVTDAAAYADLWNHHPSSVITRGDATSTCLSPHHDPEEL